MTDDIKQQYGWLAAKFEKRQLPLQVCKGPASWSKRYYLGTQEEGAPVTRESEQYWRTWKEAESALMSGNWTQRLELSDFSSGNVNSGNGYEAVRPGGRAVSTKLRSRVNKNSL
jgi:hypothetical protein